MLRSLFNEIFAVNQTPIQMTTTISARELRYIYIPSASSLRLSVQKVAFYIYEKE